MCGFYLNPLPPSPPFLRLQRCPGQTLTWLQHHSICLVASEPLQYLPAHFLALPLALWAVHQLLTFHFTSTTSPLPVSMSVLQPTCWEEKWKSWKSEIWCPKNLSHPVPSYSRGWNTYTQGNTTGHEKGRWGDGYSLFTHSDKCLSTPIRAPAGQGGKALTDYYFP